MIPSFRLRARGVHGSSKTISTLVSRHSHKLTHASSTLFASLSHGATLRSARTHGRRSLILHNCTFYCPYKLASHIGHFICKLPKNNVANIRAILEGAEPPPIASPSASVMAALRCLPTARPPPYSPRPDSQSRLLFPPYLNLPHIVRVALHRRMYTYYIHTCTLKASRLIAILVSFRISDWLESR